MPPGSGSPFAKYESVPGTGGTYGLHVLNTVPTERDPSSNPGVCPDDCAVSDLINPVLEVATAYADTDNVETGKTTYIDTLAPLDVKPVPSTSNDMKSVEAFDYLARPNYATDNKK